MVTQVKSQAVTDKNIIFEMRRVGAPMREIGEKVGISKERVRQILARNDGSTRHEWLSTSQLCVMTGLSWKRVLKLHEKGIIVPVSTWDTGKSHHLLWAADSVQTIVTYYDTHRLCPVCNRRLPKNRILFCSNGCRQERRKYKNMTPEEKRRALANIRRYRGKKRIFRTEKTIQDKRLKPIGFPGWLGRLGGPAGGNQSAGMVRTQTSLNERHNPSRGRGSGGNRAEQQDLPLHREGRLKHNGLAIL